MIASQSFRQRFPNITVSSTIDQGKKAVHRVDISMGDFSYWKAQLS